MCVVSPAGGEAPPLQGSVFLIRAPTEDEATGLPRRPRDEADHRDETNDRDGDRQYGNARCAHGLDRADDGIAETPGCDSGFRADERGAALGQTGDAAACNDGDRPHYAGRYVGHDRCTGDDAGDDGCGAGEQIQNVVNAGNEVSERLAQGRCTERDQDRRRFEPEKSVAKRNPIRARGDARR